MAKDIEYCYSRSAILNPLARESEKANSPDIFLLRKSTISNMVVLSEY